MVRRVLVLVGIASAGFVVPGATNIGAVAPTAPVVTSTQTLTAPDANVTGFGDGFSLDEHRAVAAAKRGTAKVVYVFDRNANGTWSHTATIPAPAGATPSWGTYLAVSGDTIAVSDPVSFALNENYGSIHLFDLVAGVWTPVQTLRQAGDFRFFAQGIWLSGDGLVVRDAGYCDATCNYGRWFLYERNPSNQFVQRFDSYPIRKAPGMTVGVDAGRFAVGNPGFVDDFSCEVTDSSLLVTDTNTDPPSTLLDVTIPYTTAECGGIDDWYHRVDISGDVVAYEACCTDRQELHILRRNGTAYVSEAVLPISAPSNALLAVPDVILRVDGSAKEFHTHVFNGVAWVAGGDIALPDDAVLPAFDPLRSPPVAAGNLVAIRGAESVHILTVVPSALLCLGRPVTVQLALGQTPTSGDDVILGTAGNDHITAGAGNDRVCAASGNDVIAAGAGNDIVDAGAGNDIVNGGTGNDIVSGGDGIDLIVDAAGNNFLAGGAGIDLIFAGAGNDWLACGSGFDIAFGGPGTDIASGCEITVSVP